MVVARAEFEGIRTKWDNQLGYQIQMLRQTRKETPCDLVKM